MRTPSTTRLALHAANLLAIAFFVLPLVAAILGALQAFLRLQRPEDRGNERQEEEGDRQQIRPMQRQPCCRWGAHRDLLRRSGDRSP